MTLARDDLPAIQPLTTIQQAAAVLHPKRDCPCQIPQIRSLPVPFHFPRAGQLFVEQRQRFRCKTLLPP